MKHITFYFDVISPYAYLAFEHLPEALKGVSYSVATRPCCLPACSNTMASWGPAEIAPKRDWTYRQALWLAHSKGIALKMPASHPFNPLPLLRLAVACGTRPKASMPNRYVCETIFRHVWQGGDEAADAQRLAALTAQLAPQRDVSATKRRRSSSATPKPRLRTGVFGVPAIRSRRKNFLGPGRTADAARVPAGQRLV
jgi:2-hydroxychromene-2-carboxylate isomerase